MLRYAKDLWICLGLFAAALLVRAWLALQLPFPQLDDPASYIQVARHVAQGRGLVTDVIWNFWLPFDTVTHPSNEFWMPLASLLMASAIGLLGDTLLAAQVIGLASGSLVVVLTYWLGRTLWPQQRVWSVLAAVLLLPGAVSVFQAVSADSSALYTLLSTATIFAAAQTITQRRLSWAVATGVLSGFSYLARSHGLLLPLTIGLVWTIYFWRDRRLTVKFVLVLIACYAALVIPWWVRNVQVFGVAQPVPLTTIMASREYADWYNYTDHPTILSMLAMGWPVIFNTRLEAVVQGAGVLLLLTFPYGLVGLPMIYVRREPLFRLFAVYGTLLFLGVTIILPSSSITGAWYHSAGTAAVFAALGSIYAIKWLFERRQTRVVAVALYAVFIGLCLGQALVAWPSVIARSRYEGQQFAAIAQWLQANVPPGEPILTTQANSLNYASGYPAISIPHKQGAAILRQVANRYRARLVVITERNPLYPDVLDEPASGFELVVRLPETAIYRLQP